MNAILTLKILRNSTKMNCLRKGIVVIKSNKFSGFKDKEKTEERIYVDKEESKNLINIIGKLMKKLLEKLGIETPTTKPKEDHDTIALKVKYFM
jgi:hypothetical protein